MLLLYTMTIFVRNWLVIDGSEMLPALRLNEPSGSKHGDTCQCSEKAVKLLDVEQRHDATVAGAGEGHVAGAGEGHVAGAGEGHMQPSVTPGPMERLDAIIWNFLFGHIRDGGRDLEIEPKNTNHSSENDETIKQYPSGHFMHGELFMNKSSVHLPSPDLLHTEHSRLLVSEDYLQTAVNAFAIILEGGLADVLALPSSYVLRSARTISLMKIPQEKLSAMWDVVLAGRPSDTITYEILELYRPLFKYLGGKQMARLNLTDTRIVNYIGTHPELTRHQVGVVASKYIKTNPGWRHPKYLNNMNNLLCGVPMTFMRRIEDSAYLKLEQQVFYHIRACDPLQRRFYLNMMTRTQALGKSFSWSARDVSRLGLLLAEVDGPALAAISPDAMAGLSSHVMAEMRPENLKYFTEVQVRHVKPKARNIMSRKIKEYDTRMEDTACRVVINIYLSILLFAINITLK